MIELLVLLWTAVVVGCFVVAYNSGNDDDDPESFA